ncbi:TetR/AcrR family transcriptional regulator [Cutibacterium equinum]|uniref:TetR/AcrR family transcriptional regulator n=1 Tax=Cutibacterium equinum TaxID=3016342 RepID=A0ABY7QXG9_9ACTN|nr:TetR/AcrR family transcriptional regulator [Cutibacterium equinum]WCC79732.1 TetR/AcrR family transcriptional regulator [Cutibacterium equinum]
MISKRPGRKPAFTRRQAIDAALAEGIETFTLRAVADRLGVKATALYREFSSRQELQWAALAEIVVDIEPDPDVTSWQDALRQVVDRQWELFEGYPEAPRVIITQPEAFGAAMPFITTIVHTLADLGIPGGVEGAAFALDFVGDTVLETFVSIQPYLTADEGGRTGIERIGEMTDGQPDVFGVQSMGARGNLDLKIEFIIAGMEHGLFPGSTPQK